LAATTEDVWAKRSEFDADPWIVGVEGGFVDLRTGRYFDLSGCPAPGEHLISKQLGAIFDPERHKVRSTLAHHPLFLLEGDVEVDETYIGGYRPGRSGRGVDKTGGVVAVERRKKTAGSMRLIQIPNATRAVLNSFVENSIRTEETTVFTDAWGSYKALTQLGIDHRPRNGGHGHQALDILPWAHTALGNLKTWLRGAFHAVSPKHLQRYLDEFSYRFDRRWNERELFGFVLRRVAGGQPLPYRLLVAEGTA
jgi:transposase-like protein